MKRGVYNKLMHLEREREKNTFDTTIKYMYKSNHVLLWFTHKKRHRKVKKKRLLKKQQLSVQKTSNCANVFIKHSTQVILSDVEVSIPYLKHS